MSLAALDNLVRIGQLKAEPRNVAEVSRRPASADFSKILRAPCMPIHGPMQLMHSHQHFFYNIAFHIHTQNLLGSLFCIIQRFS